MTAARIIMPRFERLTFPPPVRLRPAADPARGPCMRKSFCFSVEFFPFSIPWQGRHNGSQGHPPRVFRSAWETPLEW
jgi:hypothetical protein